MASHYQLEKFDNGMHFIMLDEATVTALTKDGNRRAICTLNDVESFHRAIMPRKEGGHYIIVGSTVCKKLKIKQGATVSASFRIDTTPYQFDMPEELMEVLATDENANTIFQQLTDGNKRGLIYLVQQVKSSNKKIERALKIAEQLKRGITSPRQMLQ